MTDTNVKHKNLLKIDRGAFLLEEYKALRSLVLYLNARLEKSITHCAIIVSVLCLIALGGTVSVSGATWNFVSNTQRLFIVFIALISVLYMRSRYNSDRLLIQKVVHYLSSVQETIYENDADIREQIFGFESYMASHEFTLDEKGREPVYRKSKNAIWIILSLCCAATGFVILLSMFGIELP